MMNWILRLRDLFSSVNPSAQSLSGIASQMTGWP
jgi:hypothetical protein